jgi:hypothetical protein
MTPLILICVVCAIAGAVIAQSKNRPAWHGAFAGGLVGPIGVLIVAVAPKLEPGSKAVTRTPAPIGSTGTRSLVRWLGSGRP